jgi:asparagine synthase (glutamine-hydrolysing)
MCGIAGGLDSEADRIAAAVNAMCTSMLPRGPDDGGLEMFREATNGCLCLGARRLAIIDPSRSGHQPMTDDGQSTTIVFNGMIYNFRELRRELEARGAKFHSHCDTEVVLKAYESHGPCFVEKLRGMFALAIWDSRERKLILARDRLGIKPLYYAHSARRFVFASQVKALLASGLVEERFSRDALITYLSFGAVSEPLTIIEGVRALPAGHIATLRDGELQLSRYWAPEPATESAHSPEEAVAELRAMLDEIVGGHLVSDAPLGVFLSGGLDSSVLAALASRQTDRLKTISVVFGERAYSEEEYIDSVTRRLGADHVRVSLGATDFCRHLPAAFAAMDQPSFDGINTFFVSKAGHDAGLKVALSGVGADELFDGYGNAGRVRQLERMRRLPKPLPQMAVAAAGFAAKGSRVEKLREWTSGPFPPGHSYELLRRLFLPDQVQRLVSTVDSSNAVPATTPVDPRKDVFPQVSMLELTNYMKNVLLRDTDAMSMANSLEVRVPYLDHRLVEWALGLPRSARVGNGKALLVAAARGAVPEEVLTRKKRGFLLPLENWMRDDLAEDVLATLSDPPTAVRELLDDRTIRSVWARFTSERESWLRPWSLYALCKWAESLAQQPAVTRPP